MATVKAYVVQLHRRKCSYECQACACALFKTSAAGADRVNHRYLLMIGLCLLIVADIILALGEHWLWTLLGSMIWGLHMGMTKGLLATMVANAAPTSLRGTAFGFFNLVSGISLLIASVLAGILWQYAGPALTFYAGAGFCMVTLIGLALRPDQERPTQV